MTEVTKHVDQWLRDAHAMEKQAVSILRGQSGRIKHYPELAARMEEHLEETNSQIERLEACMERRGTSKSGMKDAGAQLTAMMQNLSGVFAGDEVMKSVLASYAFENMEIASYRILAAAAKAEGDTQTAELCDALCKEEEAMADWLKDHMGTLTGQFLERSADDDKTAKR